ncbi:MAG TPA: hypothetical protein VFS66_03090 [Acidimicrobiia bacterium]|nr:hypothetical protein [Acidimicrobiia bacterium]
MTPKSEPPGCRSAAISAGLLVAAAIVFMAVGLALGNDQGCVDGCETLALTMLFAGLPVSAVFMVSIGDLVLAWPLDITFWVVIGFLLARLADNRDRSVLGLTLVTILIALGYGLVLSQFVELAI